MPKKDFTQVAFDVVRQATGQAPKPTNTPRQENSRKGGLKGGKARAEKLTADRRSEIAKKAASARWKPKQDEEAKKPEFPPAKKKHIGA